jgi:hypothetical protein
MKTPALLLLCFTTGSVYAESWKPSEALLGAVRRIESADGRFTVGDEGRSLGDYQIGEAAWCDVNSWRTARGLPTFEYETHVWSEPVSRTYAADYLKILREQLKKRLGRAPSSRELYAAYNMGMTSFARRNYRVTSTSATAAKRNLRIETALLGR